MQIVPSDVGVTSPNITAENRRQFILELVKSVVKGDLECSKFNVALQASGTEVTPDVSEVIADALWFVSINVEEAEEEQVVEEPVAQVEENGNEHVRDL